MPYPPNCPPYPQWYHGYAPPWWEHHRYDYPPRPQPPPPPPPPRNITRSHSTPCIPQPDKRIRIYVNIRYKYTSNRQTLLGDELCVEMNPRCCVMDVWDAAVHCNPHLRYFYPTQKVLATDSDQCHFTELCSSARIKDEYHRSERHWVFVVHPPYNYVQEEKEKKKEKKREKKPREKQTDPCSCCCCCS